MNSSSISIHLLKFPVNLRELRKEKGLSQTEVAETLNISLRKYQRLESGEATPKLDEIYMFKQLFGVNFEQLLNNSRNELPGFFLEPLEKIDTNHMKLFRRSVNDISEHFRDIAEKRLRTLEPITKESEFQKSKLPLMMCDFQTVYQNEALIEYAKKHGVDVPVKCSSSSMWHSVHEFLTMTNKLIEKGKTYFTLTSEGKLKWSSPDLHVLGFYEQLYNDHFLLASPVKV